MKLVPQKDFQIRRVKMYLKVLLLLSISAFCSSLPLIIEPNALPEAGASTQYKTEDNHGNYAFGYSEDHTSGGSFRKEQGDAFGNKVGSYGLHNADGRARVVNYVADSAGFRADVHTNEPGVDGTQDPASVAVNKPAVVTTAVVVAPAAHVHTPAVVAPAVSLIHPHVLHTPFMYTSLLAHGPHVLL